MKDICLKFPELDIYSKVTNQVFSMISINLPFLLGSFFWLLFLFVSCFFQNKNSF